MSQAPQSLQLHVFHQPLIFILCFLNASTGNSHIIYALFLVIAGRSVNIFLKPRLKEWITQLWQGATTARLLTGPLPFLPCLVEDGIRSSFHLVASGLKSNGKVCSGFNCYSLAYHIFISYI